MSRRTTVMFSLSLVLFSVAGYAADLSPRVASGSAVSAVRTGQREAGDVSNLPRIAHNQERPKPKAHVSTDNQDVENGWACMLDNSCPDDYMGDSGYVYVSGGCNCKRNCVVGSYSCKISATGACKIASGSTCESCTNADCPE